MKAEAIKGHLTYVDTERWRIYIADNTDGQGFWLDVVPDIQPPPILKWEDIVGDDIEAIIIDGKVTRINLIENEK